MIAAYFRIVRIARGHNSALTKFDREHRPVTNSKRTWKSIRTSCTIVGAFLICWAPVGIFILLVVGTDVEDSLRTVGSANVILTYLLGIGVFNSVLNPLIYAVQLDVIRKRMPSFFNYIFKQKQTSKPKKAQQKFKRVDSALSQSQATSEKTEDSSNTIEDITTSH
ncbi:hypothetical protein ScPMuIL_009124 [Solemya velum]